MHELNQHFFPAEKQIRISGVLEPTQDPYQSVRDPDIKGRFDFDFKANVLNASKLALQQGLRELMGIYVSPLAIEAGISTPETIYRLLRDFGKALGQDPDAYLQEPFPGASKPPILAEEAITMIMDSQMPEGPPMEGAPAHLQKLQAFTEVDEFGFLTPDQVKLFQLYMEEIARQARAAQQQTALAEAAGDTNTNGGEAPGETPEMAPPMANQNELIDESLPTAGGGGSQ
jgi:hypothetical protein